MRSSIHALLNHPDSFRLIWIWAAFCATTARGALVWEALQVTRDLAASEEKALVEFTFKNTGTTTESILSVDADCGCVTLESRKQNDFAPGEGGKIVANVELRKRRGVIEKHISVLTTDYPDKPTILTARIVILPPAEMGKGELVWGTDEALQEKEAPIILRTKLEARLVPLSPEARESLQVDLLPANGTEGPRLRVKPRRAGISGIYTIFVEIKGAGENFSLPLLVRLGG